MSIRIVTTGPKSGDVALPVYLYTGRPSGGRPISGNPATNVVVITDANLRMNGGQYTIEGRVALVPVSTFVEGTVETVADGAPAIPIYIVGSE
jgi:hypothetical protein